MSSSGAFYHYHEPVLDWSVFYVVCVIASYTGIVGLALAVASGLFYLAELAEEYSTLTKKILRWLIGATMVVHVLIGLIDGLCWWRSALSLAVNILYAQLLRTFPWVAWGGPLCNTVIAAFVLDNVAWYSFFMAQLSEIPFWAIVSYMVSCLWLVPIGFFISLAVADEQLPAGFSSSRIASGGKLGESAAQGGKGKRRTLAALLGALTGKREV